MTEHATPEELTELFDLLAARQTVTRQEIADHLGIRIRRADVVIHDLRLMFGADDTINLVCNRAGRGQPADYFLTGCLDDAKPWTLERIGDAESRLETIAAILRSLVAGTDGRTIDGKMARLLERTIVRAQEDLSILQRP